MTYLQCTLSMSVNANQNVVMYLIQRLHSLCEVYLFGIPPQIYTRYLRPPIPLSVMVLSAIMGLNLGVFAFLADPTRNVFAFLADPTHKNKCVHDLRALRSALRVFDFTLILQYMQVTHALDEPRLFWLREKTQRPPNWDPCRDQDGVGSRISGVYLWIWHSLLWFTKHKVISHWITKKYAVSCMNIFLCRSVQSLF